MPTVAPSKPEKTLKGKEGVSLFAWLTCTFVDYYFLSRGPSDQLLEGGG
jgi:hypothetical protein